MTLLNGISYNFRGLLLGIKTPSLLVLGMIRFVVTLALSLFAIGLVLTKYQQIANLIWTQPESAWVLWLWYVFSWVLVLLLAAVSTLVAFLVAQLLFATVIMDYMSRITERKALISMGVMIVGWLTPLSPILTIVSPVIAGTFLAWDNTDLVPARRLEPIRSRFRFLRENIKFHVGFGLGFLIPGLNILLLSYAPVGATLFFVEQIDKRTAKSATPLEQTPDLG
ncbi:MAG: EI24 domain-containing protein [Desulfobacteraceae bacterium]